MKVLPDTSIWVEHLRGNIQYFSVMSRLLEENTIVGAEWIFGELLQGCKNSRELELVEKFSKNVPLVPSEGVWIEAGVYSSKHKLNDRGVGLIDSAILVAAKRASAKIWTLDKKFKNILSEKIIQLLSEENYQCKVLE